MYFSFVTEMPMKLSFNKGKQEEDYTLEISIKIIIILS